MEGGRVWCRKHQHASKPKASADFPEWPSEEALLVSMLSVVVLSLRAR